MTTVMHIQCEDMVDTRQNVANTESFVSKCEISRSLLHIFHPYGSLSGSGGFHYLFETLTAVLAPS
jgi:hypothetical protein